MNNNNPEYDIILEYQNLAEREVQKELETHDPVKERFKYVTFLSRSKGKNRKRKHWTTIELISMRTHWVSFEIFPFDVYATECFPYHENPTELLKERIRGL